VSQCGDEAGPMGGMLAEPTCPSGFCPETCQSFGPFQQKLWNCTHFADRTTVFFLRHALKKKKADGGLVTIFGQIFNLKTAVALR